MKAVKQIIDYLRCRGILSNEQLAEYAAEGLLRWDEVYESLADGEAPPSDEGVPTSPTDDDDYEDVYSPITEERRKGPVQHRGLVLEAVELAQRLRERFSEWEDRLQGLWRVGRRLNGCTTWPEAAVVIRNAPSHDLWIAVARGLEEDDPPLNVLWDALGLEAYRSIVEERGLHGPAVAAYRAVLAVDEHNELGRYAWLLREQEVAAVYNLREAQRRLLLACESALRFRPDLIAAALRRSYHPLAYWSLVLVYTARRFQPGGRLMPGDEEHRPPRPVPDEAGWMQAWAQATPMAPRSMTVLLVEHTTMQSQRPGVISSLLQDSLAPLTGRRREVLDLYYARRLGEGPIAAQLSMPEAEVAQQLAEHRTLLRRALESNPMLQAPRQPEEVRPWEAFLEDCLWWCFNSAGATRDLEFQQLMSKYFGPAADLVCPNNWDD